MAHILAGCQRRNCALFPLKKGMLIEKESNQVVQCRGPKKPGSAVPCGHGPAGGLAVRKIRYSGRGRTSRKQVKRATRHRKTSRSSSMSRLRTPFPMRGKEPLRQQALRPLVLSRCDLAARETEYPGRWGSKGGAYQERTSRSQDAFTEG